MNSKAKAFELPIPTSDGVFIATYSEKGLCGLSFPTDRQPPKPGRDAVPPPERVLAWHRLTIAALECALAGQSPKSTPPLDYFSGTEFQKAVWRVMLKIRLGRTMSYAEVAQAVGKPKALRAVGAACGANRIPVLVPCHRVLASRKGIGGFGGGLDWKRKLLEREGAEFIG